METSLIPRARSSSNPSGSVLTIAICVGLPAPSRPGVTKRRRTASGAAAASSAREASRASSTRVDGPDLDPCRRARKPRQVLVELERVAAIHPRRLERSAAAEERLVVHEEDRLVGVDKSASADCEGEQRHLAAGSSTGARSRLGAAAPSPTTPRSPPRARSPRRCRPRPTGGSDPPRRRRYGS